MVESGVGGGAVSESGRARTGFAASIGFAAEVRVEIRPQRGANVCVVAEGGVELHAAVWPARVICSGRAASALTKACVNASTLAIRWPPMVVITSPVRRPA